MKLEVESKETKAGCYTVSIKGRIDSDNYLDFESKVSTILEGKAKNVLLDMAGVNYISSAGLGVIFAMMKKLKETNGEFLLCNLQPQIKKVLEIVKALPSSSVFSSVEEADSYIETIMSRELKKKEDEE